MLVLKMANIILKNAHQKKKPKMGVNLNEKHFKWLVKLMERNFLLLWF